MNRKELIAKTPVFILCGGLGTRIKEETEFKPPTKPLDSFDSALV